MKVNGNQPRKSHIGWAETFRTTLKAAINRAQGQVWLDRLGAVPLACNQSIWRERGKPKAVSKETVRNVKSTKRDVLEPAMGTGLSCSTPSAGEPCTWGRGQRIVHSCKET
jgi:hypothetical protein